MVCCIVEVYVECCVGIEYDDCVICECYCVLFVDCCV